MSDKYQLIAAELADQDSQPVADPDQWPVSVQSMCQVLGGYPAQGSTSGAARHPRPVGSGAR